MSFKDNFSVELKMLREQRDELRVQLNLASKEIRDRWEELEKHWHHLEAKARAVGKESQESLNDIGEAAHLLAGEIREGYRHIRKSL